MIHFQVNFKRIFFYSSNAFKSTWEIKKVPLWQHLQFHIIFTLLGHWRQLKWDNPKPICFRCSIVRVSLVGLLVFLAAINGSQNFKWLCNALLGVPYHNHALENLLAIVWKLTSNQFDFCLLKRENCLKNYGYFMCCLDSTEETLCSHSCYSFLLLLFGWFLK